MVTDNLALKLTALATSLAAFSIEDIEAVKAGGQLGPDVAANIQKLQTDSQKFDDEGIAALNAQRTADNLSPE